MVITITLQVLQEPFNNYSKPKFNSGYKRKWALKNSETLNSETLTF